MVRNRISILNAILVDKEKFVFFLSSRAFVVDYLVSVPVSITNKL